MFTTLSCDAQPTEAPVSLQLVTMTYNIRHGAGADGVVDMERIAAVILSAQPDLVAIQEVDRFVERTNRVDQAEQLATLTGMHMAFGFADNYQGGDFGNVILSKYPIEDTVVHPLPGPPGETRAVLEARINLPEGEHAIPVIFMSTHLETFEEPRRASAPLINDILPATPETLYVLGGDMNAVANTPTMDTLALKWRNPAAGDPVFTHPASDPVRQIDYLLYQGPASWSVEEVYAIEAPISSDHAPLVTVFNYRTGFGID